MEFAEPRIIFMGTPDFAVESLKVLLQAGRKIVAVVTAPDKPAGRGKTLQSSPVKAFALEHNLKVLQPEKLKNPQFIEELKSLNPELQVVVAFRMLPEAVWSLPVLGTFNLHASLLPQYRGAAPINWALINGEKETGVTTFFINHEIDTGKIIFSEKVPIGDKETAGELHDRLMVTGARLVLKTVDAIAAKNAVAVEQNAPKGNLKNAPKIFKEDCRINWNENAEKIFNFIRGLSPYPGAFTEIVSPEGKRMILKIFYAENIPVKHAEASGSIETDGKTCFRIAASEGYLDVLNLQLEGKKRLNIKDFLRGFPNPEQYRII